jgi:N6-adenosine-specific RNA methylase IME4
MPEARKVELFARARQPGWDVWGNQTDLFPARDAIAIGKISS